MSEQFQISYYKFLIKQNIQSFLIKDVRRKIAWYAAQNYRHSIENRKEHTRSLIWGY